MSRKKPLLLPFDSVSCSCRVAELSAGQLVNVVHVFRSGLSCKTMFVEGTIQEKNSLLLAGARSNCGDGAVFDIQIPFVPFAINSFPSAEQATQAHGASGRLFDIHDAPRLVEVQIS